MHSNQNSKKQLFLLIIFAFICKVLFVVFFIDSAKLWEVNDIALNLLRTGEMKYFHDGKMNYNYQFPIYPFFVF